MRSFLNHSRTAKFCPAVLWINYEAIQIYLMAYQIQSTTKTVLCCFFRGKCCVTLLNETEALKSYLEREVSVTACCFYACANAFVLFPLADILWTESEMFIWCVCVWELVWVPIQMNNSVCWPSMFLLIFSNEETRDSTKSQASPLISQTLALTGSFVYVYIKGQEHTSRLSLVYLITSVLCLVCVLVLDATMHSQWCTKLSLAFVYFNAVCFWP